MKVQKECDNCKNVLIIDDKDIEKSYQGDTEIEVSFICAICGCRVTLYEPPLNS